MKKGDSIYKHWPYTSKRLGNTDSPYIFIPTPPYVHDKKMKVKPVNKKMANAIGGAIIWSWIIGSFIYYPIFIIIPALIMLISFAFVAFMILWGVLYGINAILANLDILPFIHHPIVYIREYIEDEKKKRPVKNYRVRSWWQ